MERENTNRLLVAGIITSIVLLGVADAGAGSSIQKLTGGFVSGVDFTGGERVSTVKVNVVKHKDGRLTGGITWKEDFYLGGVLVNTRTAEADADEFLVVGDQAYLRAGSFFFTAVDGGEGANADPDRTAYLIFLSSPPPLARLTEFLDFIMGFGAQEVVGGNLQVEG